jgi:RNA polymerase sigma-70 factor, ECF subfamily
MFLRSRYNDVTRSTDDELCRLLRRSKRDSEHAFSELYRRYAPRLHAYCFRILEHKEEAEDVFQETFVRFVKAAREEREMSNVPGYLLRIARNLCLNRKRDHRSLASLDGLDLPATASPMFENEELLSLIGAAVEMLDEEFREAFILREYENLSYEAIAELTGTTVSNAKSRVFRARQKIKKLLEPNIRELR